MSEEPVRTLQERTPVGGGAAAPQQQVPGMQALLQMFEMLMGGRQQMMQQLIPALTQRDSKIVRKDIRGNVIQQGGGRPGGLAGFYFDNPNVRPGEFDPTGRKAVNRGALGFARQDALAGLKHANAMAKGLADLYEARNRLPEDAISVGAATGAPRRSGIFAPLLDR